MKTIIDTLKKELCLNERIENPYFECYRLHKRIHLGFCDFEVKKSDVFENSSIYKLLEKIISLYNNDNFPRWKTFIFIGFTNDEFQPNELLHFDQYGTIAVFCLINKSSHKIFTNISTVAIIGMNYKKYLKKIISILEKIT